jgi:hypothetical protein
VVARFSQPPTLGEFIARSKKYGYRLRSLSPHGSRRGLDVIRYLWRDPDHFAELPGARQSDRLSRAVLERLCRQLNIPREDFGLED